MMTLSTSAGSLPPIGYALGETDTAADLILPPLSPAAIFWSLLAAAGTAASAYHGWKRNESIGWAIVWGAAGALAPIITVPVAIAQGFSKKKSSAVAGARGRRR